MKRKISKTNEELDFLNARLDEIRMSGHERLRAKASLARAEAVAGLLVAFARALKRLLKALVLRPLRRLTAAIG